MSARNVRGSMTPILQYGLVNLVNAAIILLQVELFFVYLSSNTFIVPNEYVGVIMFKLENLPNVFSFSTGFIEYTTRKNISMKT